MKRLPFSESRFAQVFASAERARGYVDTHEKWARHAGRVFAGRLRELGRDPQRILDAGSGSGDTAVVLAKAFAEADVVGLDLSAHMVEIARERLAGTGLAERVSFVEGDATRMPFADGSFDAVISQDTLHLLDEPLPMLDECARVLRAEGALILRTVRRSWLGYLDPIFRTGFTRTELAELCGRSTLSSWRILSDLMYLTLEAGSGTR